MEISRNIAKRIAVCDAHDDLLFAVKSAESHSNSNRAGCGSRRQTFDDAEIPRQLQTTSARCSRLIQYISPMASFLKLFYPKNFAKVAPLFIHCFVQSFYIIVLRSPSTLSIFWAEIRERISRGRSGYGDPEHVAKPTVQTS